MTVRAPKKSYFCIREYEVCCWVWNLSGLLVFYVARGNNLYPRISVVLRDMEFDYGFIGDRIQTK
jgi:hypothetical protein